MNSVTLLFLFLILLFMNGLSFGQTVIVLKGMYFLTVSSKTLRKLEYTSLILSELKTRSSQFVIFSSSASPSMSAALKFLICLLKECCLKVLNEISAKTGAWVLHTGVRTSTELIKFFQLVIHISMQVPVSVVKCVASNTTFSKFKRFNIFLK